MKITLIKGDAYEEVKKIPEKSIDLVVIDPPYQIVAGGGGGAFGVDKRDYHKEVSKKMNYGIKNELLDDLCKIMKHIYIYIWCNKNQLRQYLDYFEDKRCYVDLLVWCKTNPIPTCNNKYLSDVEYLLVAREKGTKIYGSYDTKHKYYVTPLNTEDKKKYKHPTIKPLKIIENIIINSSKEGDTVLDCFMGSGTTGVACKKLGRNFIGIELDEGYFEIAKERINKEYKESTLFDIEIKED